MVLLGLHYAMPDFITYFTKIIPLTPYLEALKIMVVEKGSDFLTQKYFWHLFILGWVYFLLGWIAFENQNQNAVQRISSL